MRQVAIIIPTLGRPHLLPRLLGSIESTTPPGLVKVLFVVDRNDTPTRTWLHDCGQDYIDHDGTLPVKTNAGVRATTEPVVLPTADDVLFHPGWASALTAFDEGYAVIGTNDLSVRSGEDHATQFLVRRDYIEDPGAAWGEPGVLFHEGYHHNFIDTELAALAIHRGEYIYAKESVIEHMHVAWGKAPMDATYAKGAMSNFEQDEQLFNRRRQEWQQ